MKAKKIDSVTTIYILAGVVFVTAIMLGIWFGARYAWSRFSVAAKGEEKEVAVELPQTEVVVCNFRRRVDGVCVDTLEQAETKLTAVMIENSADAWPLSGLSAASIVYEAPVEGNIPRFMAIYTDDVEVMKVGPVRSARPYFLDWLAEYGNPPYLHVGGSPEALEKIAGYKIFDIDEFFRDWYFWRSDDRGRPHNTYTSSLLWKKARVDYETYNTDVTYEGWTFSDMEVCDNENLKIENLKITKLGSEKTVSSTDNANPYRNISDSKIEYKCADSVTASFLSPTYDVTWKYVPETGRYERYQNSEKQFDTDVPIEADTVIIQRVKVATVDEVGRKRIDTVGSGEAIVFRDGYKISGIWKKASRKERTRFFDEEGNEITLRGGKIWIEVIGRGAEVTVE